VPSIVELLGLTPTAAAPSMRGRCPPAGPLLPPLVKAMGNIRLRTLDLTAFPRRPQAPQAQRRPAGRSL